MVTRTRLSFRLCVYWCIVELQTRSLVLQRLSVISRSLAARSEHMWTAHLFGSYKHSSRSPAIRQSNIQRSTKHLIYCLIKQTAETPPALVELLCTPPSHGCYHVVCSRYDWPRGESKGLFLPSLHAYIYIYIYIYIFVSIYSKP